MAKWCAPVVLLFALFIASEATSSEPLSGGDVPVFKGQSGGPEANIDNPNQGKRGEKEAAGTESDWDEVKKVFKRIFKDFSFHGDVVP